MSDLNGCRESFDIVQVSDSGDITVSNTSAGTVDVAVTVMGYYQMGDATTPGDTYVSLPVDTIVDTRSGLGAPDAQIPAGGSLTVQVSGQGGIPSDAAGAALFIGAANASANGYVSAYPTGGTPSSLSLLSYVPGQVVHDLYFGTLSSTGQLTLVNQGSAPVDLMVVVQGYLVSPAATEAGSGYVDVAEQQIVNTTNGTGGVSATPVPAGGSITFTPTGGDDDVPATGVSSVAESVQAMNANATGYLSVYAGGAADPDAPGVNFYAGGNQDNGLTAALVSAVSPTGEQTITNHSSGTVNVVVSLRGYFQSPTQPDEPGAVTARYQGARRPSRGISPTPTEARRSRATPSLRHRTTLRKPSDRIPIRPASMAWQTRLRIPSALPRPTRSAPAEPVSSDRRPRY